MSSRNPIHPKKAVIMMVANENLPENCLDLI
jgi:hypothetical protein